MDKFIHSKRHAHNSREHHKGKFYKNVNKAKLLTSAEQGGMICWTSYRKGENRKVGEYTFDTFVGLCWDGYPTKQVRFVYFPSGKINAFPIPM